MKNLFGYIRVSTAKQGEQGVSLQAQQDAILRVLGPAGDVSAAVTQFELMLSEPGYSSLEALLPDPRLDAIRDDPRFQALVEKYKRQ